MKGVKKKVRGKVEQKSKLNSELETKLGFGEEGSKIADIPSKQEFIAMEFRKHIYIYV